MHHYNDKFVGESELKTALRSLQIGRNGMNPSSVLLHNGRPKKFMKFWRTYRNIVRCKKHFSSKSLFFRVEIGFY